MIIHTGTAHQIPRLGIPRRSSLDTGNLAGTAFETPCILHHHLSCLFVDRIEVSRADKNTHTLLALCADCLIKFNMAFLIVLYCIECYLLFNLHSYMFLMLMKSLHPSQLRTYFFATALALLYSGSFGPFPIVKTAFRSSLRNLKGIGKEPFVFQYLS